MKITKIIRRFAIPSFFTSIYMIIKNKVFVSPKAEVELSHNLYVGKGTKIGSFTKIKTSEGILKIGKNVSIGSNCFIGSNRGGLSIGNDCLIGPSVIILNSNYNYVFLDIPIRLQETYSKGVVIGDNVWIGAGVCILDGTSIGHGCIIAPNSLVSGKFPPNSILQGNPAKKIFQRR